MMMVDVEEAVPITSIQISGPTLSSLLQRFTAAQYNFQGLLFGHTTLSNPTQFTDHNPTPTIPTSIATITSFLITPLPKLPSQLDPKGLIGYFSARKRSPLRPSLNESSFLSRFSNRFNGNNVTVFLLITSPVTEGSDENVRVHTTEYRGYHYCLFDGSFGLVPKSLEVVNIGPSFRSHYDSFSSSFPLPGKIGSVFYPCSFLVLNSPSMALLLLGLDVLIKHQCIIYLKNYVFRICIGEASIPFLQEKDVPRCCLEEERCLKIIASGSKAMGMMYVDVYVNGEPLKAFVDNRAQSTVISKSCAERCGYKSISHGVGYPEILGCVHVAPSKVESVFYPCSFMVLDSLDIDCIFGFDMLCKHQCIINLKENVMRVGEEEVSVPLL